MSRIVFLFAVLVSIGCASCSPPADSGEQFSMTDIPRLAKYYPEVSAAGDTSYHTLPVGKYINQYGDSFSTEVLMGKISVTQLFFTSCEGICPVISGNMFSVQKAFAGNSEVKLVSLSVDPARDSVGALRKYASRFKCDSTQWTLLTGDKKKIYDQARYGYLLPGIEPGKGDEEDFIHSDRLTLADRDGIIRGYYDGTDTAQVRLLIEDLRNLLNQK